MDAEWVQANYKVDLALDFEESSKVIVNYLLLKLNEPVRSQSASLIELDKTQRVVKVAYPSFVFDDNNMTQWLNLLALPTMLQGIRLDAIRLSQGLCKGLRGPRFGLSGIKESLKMEYKSQPLLCFMPNVKTDSKPDLLRKIAYEAAVGGVNIFIDDELLNDQDFCRLEARVSSISEGLDKAQQETGSSYLYAANISSDYPELLERAEIALENGASCLMVCDVFTAVPEVKSLRNDPTLNAPIYVQSAQHLAKVVSKGAISVFLRLAGADMIFTNEESSADASFLKGLIEHLDCAPHFLPSVPIMSLPKELSALKNVIAEFDGKIAILIKKDVEGSSLGNVTKYIRNYVDVIKTLYQ
ncbi:MAG: RuBisCO large subunit C-terminal-like domain-containing protein [Candidatus Bathyarchaeia archaeon]